MTLDTITIEEARRIVAEKFPGWRLLDLADPSHPDHHPRAPELLKRAALGLPFEDPKPPAPPRDDPCPDVPEPYRAPPTTMMRKIRVIKECTHWTREGCGCAGGRCLAGKGQLGTGLVSYQDCFACLGI